MKEKNKAKVMIISTILVAIAIAFDQITKYMAVVRLKGAEEIRVLGDILVLQYVENKGAAFGILQNQRIFFLVLTIVVLVVLGLILYRMPSTRRFLPLRITICMLVAGAIGNMIDRMIYAHVVDFLYVKIINFPVFNVADIFLTISMIALFVEIMFVYSDHELGFLKRKKAGVSDDTE